MKKILLAAFVMVAVFTSLQAQTHSYEIVPDSKAKILKGFLQRSDIEQDTSFKWFKTNYSLGSADANAVAAFKNHASEFRVIIFAGTWCEDSENLLPQFYRLADKSGFSAENILLIGVDRAKTAPNNLENFFNVTMSPTFIIMKDGKEVGRVEEYGKYGQVDKELGEIVAGMK